jgi:hypothetical protein
MRGMRQMFGVAAAGLMLAGSVLGAAAHEHREVGNYEFVVGFISEPAISEELNGLSLRVTQAQAPDAAAATPVGDAATPAAVEPVQVGVEGLESTLQAEVIYGDQKMTLTLSPAWQDPGAYQSWFIPMQPGDYSFHIWGEINGQQVDETFTSSPDGFDSVQDRTTLQFPQP